jgi:pSer/pThr/pTyr-binding forkhead associated (FHA) protein
MHAANSSELPLRVSIHLLDSSHGAVMQTWQFDGQESITLGRSSERDVRVGDQHVSRLHAELRFDGEHWVALSHGRNGLLVDGEQTQRAPLKEKSVVRLGPEGPMLSVRFERVSNDSLATLEASVMPVVHLKIDEERKAREVTEIVEGQYFQQLRSRARQLRSKP